MNDVSSQPTILVKKADGTSVRMTMAEFRAYRENMKALKHENIKTSPMTKDEKKDLKIERLKDDVSSVKFLPPMVTSKKMGNVVQLKNDAELETVMKRIAVPTGGIARERLRSLVVSRLRGIRSDADMRPYLERSVREGGAGLNNTEIESVFAAIGRGNGVIGDIKNIKDIENIADGKRTFLTEERTEITKLRYNDIAEKNKDIENSKNIKNIGSVSTVQSVQHAPMVKGETYVPPAAPSMRDVTRVPSEKRSMGPVDELRAMTLSDWRRLGSTSAERAERVKGKFEGLKAESYMLYLDGAAAWKESPLYRAYLAAVFHALSSGVPLREALGDLKEEEIGEIVALNNSIT